MSAQVQPGEGGHTAGIWQEQIVESLSLRASASDLVGHCGPCVVHRWYLRPSCQHLFGLQQRILGLGVSVIRVQQWVDLLGLPASSKLSMASKAT
jgi:hypothetical protein